MIQVNGWWIPFEYKGSYLNLEPDLPKALKHVKDWSLAIDGGAYVGVVTKHLLEKFETVYAVELAPDTTECLKLNCPEAISINACLGFVRERVSYIGDKDPNSPIRCVTVGRPLHDGNVRTITIDSLNLPSCGFIKLDLQGYDYFALRGAEETLRQFHPVVMFEHDGGCFKRYGIKGTWPGQFLSDLGYKQVSGGANHIWI